MDAEITSKQLGQNLETDQEMSKGSRTQKRDVQDAISEVVFCMAEAKYIIVEAQCSKPVTKVKQMENGELEVVNS